MNDLTLLIIISAGFGILGALLRILVTAAQITQLKKKIALHGFSFYALIALISGAFAGIMLDYGKVGSVLAGYAALDLMDGFYSSLKKSTIKVKRS